MLAFPTTKTTYPRSTKFIKRKSKRKDTLQVHPKIMFQSVRLDKDPANISNSNKSTIQALKNSFDLNSNPIINLNISSKTKKN